MVCDGHSKGQHTSSPPLTFHCPPQLFHHVPTTNVCMFVSQAKKKKQTKKPVIRPLGTQAVTQQKVRERKPIASDKTIKEVRMNHTFDQCDYPIGSPLSGSSCMCVCVHLFQLLGELYADREYLEGLLNDKSEHVYTVPAVHGMITRACVCVCVWVWVGACVCG